jgi:hypothetical protein
MGSFDLKVGQIEKDSEFTFREVKIYHDACQGGKIIQENRGDFWKLSCTRCGADKNISFEDAALIISTAVDGQERELRHPGDQAANLVRRK